MDEDIVEKGWPRRALCRWLAYVVLWTTTVVICAVDPPHPSRARAGQGVGRCLGRREGRRRGRPPGRRRMCAEASPALSRLASGPVRPRRRGLRVPHVAGRGGRAARVPPKTESAPGDLRVALAAGEGELPVRYSQSKIFWHH